MLFCPVLFLPCLVLSCFSPSCPACSVLLCFALFWFVLSCPVRLVLGLFFWRSSLWVGLALVGLPFGCHVYKERIITLDDHPLPFMGSSLRNNEQTMSTTSIGLRSASRTISVSETINEKRGLSHGACLRSSKLKITDLKFFDSKIRKGKE